MERGKKKRKEKKRERSDGGVERKVNMKKEERIGIGEFVHSAYTRTHLNTSTQSLSHTRTHTYIHTHTHIHSHTHTHMLYVPSHQSFHQDVIVSVTSLLSCKMFTIQLNYGTRTYPRI